MSMCKMRIGGHGKKFEQVSLKNDALTIGVFNHLTKRLISKS